MDTTILASQTYTIIVNSVPFDDIIIGRSIIGIQIDTILIIVESNII